jgi:hypothetical protein
MSAEAHEKANAAPHVPSATAVIDTPLQAFHRPKFVPSLSAHRRRELLTNFSDSGCGRDARATWHTALRDPAPALLANACAKFRILTIAALCLIALPGISHADLIPYSFPDAFPTSTAYRAKIADADVPALQTERGAFLSFGMSGPVAIEVKLQAEPREVVVRPLSAGITATIDGAGFRIDLPRPMNLSVEIDGNTDDPLFIFANPELPAPPDRADPKVIFFEAGKIHDAGEIHVGDGQTLYLEGGAVVRGVVRARNASNIRIGGAGILDSGTRTHKTNKLVLRECRNAVLENLILLDPLGWTIHLSGSEDVQVTNTRVIGWRDNSDGLDIEYSSRVRVEGCFWRSNDDCIAIKAIYPPGTQGVPFEEMIDPETLGGHDVPRIEGDTIGDIHISNCVLWNDAKGQGFEIGFELRVDHIRGIVFRDSDIIHVRGGAFTIHNGDRAQIEDILIENVRVENPDRLIDFHVGLSIYSDDCPPLHRRSNPDRKAPPRENLPAMANNPYQWFVPAEADIPAFEANRGHVRNVVIRNVSTLAPPKARSILHGFSPRRNISNIHIENLEIAGEKIRTLEELDIFLEHTADIHVRADAGER